MATVTVTGILLASRLPGALILLASRLPGAFLLHTTGVRLIGAVALGLLVGAGVTVRFRRFAAPASR